MLIYLSISIYMYISVYILYVYIYTHMHMAGNPPFMVPPPGAGGHMLSVKKYLSAMLHAAVPYSLAIFGSHWSPEEVPTISAEVSRTWKGPLHRTGIADVYASSHAVLSSTIDSQREAGMVNNRVFEALACGTVLITDSSTELIDLFGLSQTVPGGAPSVNLPLLLAEVPMDVSRHLQQILEAEMPGGMNSDGGGIFDSMRRRAREVILRRHTWDHRVVEILDFYHHVLHTTARHSLSSSHYHHSWQQQDVSVKHSTLEEYTRRRPSLVVLVHPDLTSHSDLTHVILQSLHGVLGDIWAIEVHKCERDPSGSVALPTSLSLQHLIKAEMLLAILTPYDDLHTLVHGLVVSSQTEADHHSKDSILLPPSQKRIAYVLGIHRTHTANMTRRLFPDLLSFETCADLTAGRCSSDSPECAANGREKYLLQLQQLFCNEINQRLRHSATTASDDMAAESEFSGLMPLQVMLPLQLTNTFDVVLFRSAWEQQAAREDEESMIALLCESPQCHINASLTGMPRTEQRPHIEGLVEGSEPFRKIQASLVQGVCDLYCGETSVARQAAVVERETRRQQRWQHCFGSWPPPRSSLTREGGGIERRSCLESYSSLLETVYHSECARADTPLSDMSNSRPSTTATTPPPTPLSFLRNRHVMVCLSGFESWCTSRIRRQVMELQSRNSPFLHGREVVLLLVGGAFRDWLDYPCDSSESTTTNKFDECVFDIREQDSAGEGPLKDDDNNTWTWLSRTVHVSEGRSGGGLASLLLQYAAKVYLLYPIDDRSPRQHPMQPSQPSREAMDYPARIWDTTKHVLWPLVVSAVAAVPIHLLHAPGDHFSSLLSPLPPGTPVQEWGGCELGTKWVEAMDRARGLPSSAVRVKLLSNVSSGYIIPLMHMSSSVSVVGETLVVSVVPLVPGGFLAGRDGRICLYCNERSITCMIRPHMNFLLHIREHVHVGISSNGDRKVPAGDDEDYDDNDKTSQCRWTSSERGSVYTLNVTLVIRSNIFADPVTSSNSLMLYASSQISVDDWSHSNHATTVPTYLADRDSINVLVRPSFQ